jgi:outer membrane protein assembly factor BamB
MEFSQKIFRRICFVFILFMVLNSFADFPQPLIKWSVPVDVHFDAAPVPYPLDNPDGIIIGTSGHVTRIDGKGIVIFDTKFGPETSHGNYNYNISLIDLDGNGVDEIICGAYDGYIYAMNAEDGTIRWEYNLGTKLGMFHFATVADLNGDGNPEILAPNMDGWLSCLSAEGKLLWRFKSEPYRISTASVGDINNDGRIEIVIGTSTHHIIALDAGGSLLWDRVYKGLDFSRTKPMILDTEGDEAVEIYTLSCRRFQDQGLISLNGKDGSLRWHAPMTHKAYYSLVGVDLDQDGVKEILVADKRTAIAAFSTQGKLIWRSFLSGRGIWTAPAVGDINGDGSYEIIVTVRDKSSDGKNNSWYVLDSAGKTLAGFPLAGGGFGAPMITDIDRDGILEVVIASRNPGRITAFSFGGSAAPKTVLAAFERENDYPIQRFKPIRDLEIRYPGKNFISTLPTPRYGDNQIDLTLPSTNSPASIEVKTVAPGKGVTIQCFTILEGEHTAKVSWPVLQRGEYNLSLRLIETLTGSTVGSQTFSVNVNDLLASVNDRMNTVHKSLADRKIKLTDSNPETEAFLTDLQWELAAGFKIIETKVRGTVSLDIVGQNDLKSNVDDYLRQCSRTIQLADLASVMSADPQLPFILWQDKNPWDDINPLDELPHPGEPALLSTWAFGNEIESICVNVVNISTENLTLRIDPGILTGEKPLPANRYVDMFRTVYLPDSKGVLVPDLLVSLAPGYLLDLAPGQVKQIWLNIKTKDLEPGQNIFSWRIRTLDILSRSTDLRIMVDVSEIRFPEKSRFAANFWSQNQLGDIETISDLNEHLQTVWTRIGLPPAQANEIGEIVGELNWQGHDQIVLKIKQIQKILYSSPVTPRFPEGTTVTTDLKLKAQKNYAREMLKHLRHIGLDYADFAFYPIDEPGLVGGVEDYVEVARNIKAVDPNFLVYTDPAGGITVEMIQQMSDVTDVWQPDIGTVEALGKPYLEAMRKGNKEVWTYTPPGDARITKPLGFYRALAWMAFHWDMQGAGYWVYYSADLWASRPENEPDYGSVAFDGRSLLPSRRWEATRDGIEDYNMLCLLRDGLKKRPEKKIQRLLDEAVDYVANRAITAIPRVAADYDLDYLKFQTLRSKIRHAIEQLADK